MHQAVRGSFSLLSDGHDRREKVNSRAAVNWTEPDRCRWQRKGGRLSEETRWVASGAKQIADVSDRWCRQFEPDRSSQKEPHTKRCVVRFHFLTDTTEGREGNSRAAVHWTEPDRCRWQGKGGRLSEETRRVASGAKQIADVSDRWCRQFEPDRSSQNEPCAKWCVVRFHFLTDTTEGKEGNSRAAVHWTEPDRCRWQRKGGRLSEETRRVANEGKRIADVSDRWCRQFEPDRSSHLR